MAPLFATLKRSGNKRWLKLESDRPDELEQIARRTGTEVKPGTPTLPYHCDLPAWMIRVEKGCKDE